MDLRDLLSIAFASLIVLVVAHFAVYWVVKTLYPPSPTVIIAPAPERVPVVSFTEPPVTEQQQQNVTIPTYETPMPSQAPREEGERRGPPPAENTSIRGDSGSSSLNA